jgi:hypothetical protein
LLFVSPTILDVIPNRRAAAVRNLLFVIPPHNNPIVAQDFNVFALSPQSRCRALSRPRMSYKQIPRPIRPHDPAPMQLNRFLLREAVHDEEFVEGIAKWRHPPLKIRETLFIHLEGSVAKCMIYQQSFERAFAKWRKVEIKLEAIFDLV